MRRLAILLPTLFSLASASAQTLPKDVERVDGYYITSDLPQYPAEANVAGAQGKVEIRQDFLNGKPRGDATVFISSKSELLDAKALELVRQTKLKSSGTDEAPDSKKYLVTIEFARDTAQSLPNKRCGDLLTDVRYYKSIDAGASLTEMRVYKMSLGMIYMAKKRDLSEAARLAKATPQAFERTIAVCEQLPDARYMELLLKELQATP
jgi:TonB family protein